jgi:hypothetical protein
LSLVACGPPRGPQAASAPAAAAVTSAAPVASAPAKVTPGGNADEQRALAAVTADPDPARRRAAIDDYANGARGADPLLQSLASDRDPLVRRWAALALERRATRDLSPALRQALAAERDPAVENILTRALSRAEQQGS